MKIFLSILIFLSLFIPGITNSQDDSSTYSSKDGYELYKQRVKNICDQYKYNPTIANIDDNYPKIISAEKMEELIGPLEKDLEKQESEKQKKINEAIKEREEYLKQNELSNIEVTNIRSSTWVRDPNLSNEENQKSHEEYLKNREEEKNKSTEILDGTKINKLKNENNEISKTQNKINSIKNNNTSKYSFKDIKEKHRYNMNNIYKCGLISTQKKALLLIKNDLIKVNISKKIEGKISSNIERLKAMSRSFNCTETNDENSIQKLILLKQATYQTCKYINYLEYLKEYNKNIQNNLDPTKGQYTNSEIVQTQKDKLGEIDEEIKHTYKVFPLAFHAYTEYENNITAHFLLQLLKDDYIALREKLHKTLNPINQVVYKVINAMKK